MMDLLKPTRRHPGEPCSHPGCASHVSHPCEGCGRLGAGMITAPLAVPAKMLDGSHNRATAEASERLFEVMTRRGIR